MYSKTVKKIGKIMGDTKDIIKCPACDKEMTKVFLDEQGFYVDICLDGCGGIFLDNREFKKIDEQNENITPIIEAISGKEFVKPDQNKKRVCAVCGNNMVTNKVSHKNDIKIEECYTCGGKFFDLGELFDYRDEFLDDKERTTSFKKKFNSLLDDINFGYDEKFEKYLR